LQTKPASNNTVNLLTRADQGTGQAMDPGATSPAAGSAVPVASNAMQLGDLLPRYETFLRGQRGLAENTVRIYLADLLTFGKFLSRQGQELTNMDRSLLRGYLAWLATSGREGQDSPSRSSHPSGYARVSIVRKLTALRSFYRFLVQQSANGPAKCQWSGRKCWGGQCPVLPSP